MPWTNLFQVSTPIVTRKIANAIDDERRRAKISRRLAGWIARLNIIMQRFAYMASRVFTYLHRPPTHLFANSHVLRQPHRRSAESGTRWNFRAELSDSFRKFELDWNSWHIFAFVYAFENSRTKETRKGGKGCAGIEFRLFFFFFLLPEGKIRVLDSQFGKLTPRIADRMIPATA